jgi:putative DNA primase/helicase
MIELAQSEDAIPVKTEDLDRDKWLLNCDNGTLNLKTCELWVHRKEDYITKKINVSYNPDATCPTWERFLNRIFNGSQDMIKFVQKAIGYSLTGSTREQCLFILYGTGQNGKSTFITTINNILGLFSTNTFKSTILIIKYRQ